MITINLFLALCFILITNILCNDDKETSRRLHLNKLRREFIKRRTKQNRSAYKKGYINVTDFGVDEHPIPEPDFRRINPYGFEVAFDGSKWITTNPYFDGVLNGPLATVDGTIQGYFRKNNNTDMWIYRNKEIRVKDGDFVDFAISVFVYKGSRLDYIVRSKFFVQLYFNHRTNQNEDVGEVCRQEHDWK